MNKVIRILLLLIIATLTIPAWADVSIKGKVIDQRSGEALIGATIRSAAQGNQGVITDQDGAFSFQSSGQLPITLHISYVGYDDKDVEVKDSRKILVIELSENRKQLDEVVFTALGVSREKKSLGYASQQINAEELTSVRDNNILNTLHGKAAGLRITNSQGDAGSSRIIIRGETSIAGENQPLFVIDGIPVNNSQYESSDGGRSTRNALADLNPDDIASLNVLKGANAAALYGSRASHGAIIITTKSGRGQGQGWGISVHSANSFSYAASLSRYQDLFGQGAGGRFSYVDGKGGGVNDGVDESWGPRLDIGLQLPQFDSPVVNGTRTATPWVSHPDNVKDFFQTGITTNNGFSVARSGEEYDFRLSYNNEYLRSIVPGTSNNKTNVGLNTDYRLNKWLSVGTTANYIIDHAPSIPGAASSTGSNYRSNSTMLQFLWFGRQVDTESLRDGYPTNHSWNASYYDNPFWAAYYNTQSHERHRLIGDVHLNLHLAEGLDLKLRQSTDWYADKYKSKVKTGSSGAGNPYGSYSETAIQFKEDNTEAIVTYVRKINEDWNFDVLAGYNLRNKTYEYNFQKAPQLAAPDLYTLDNSRTTVTSNNNYNTLRQYSLYYSANLSYRDWAFLTVTGRNDWSSTLPVNNNSYFYPSFTGSVLLDQAFGLQLSWLDYLKVRGGWSQVGSDADPYQLATVYESSTAIVSGNTSYPIQSTTGAGNNPDLKPERTSSLEFGFETAFFHNRLRADFSYYKTDSRDQILRLSTTAASGYTSQVRNAGHIRNYGFELQLGATPIQTNDFHWDIDVNWAKNNSRVVKLDDAGEIQRYLLYSSGIDIRAEVGEAYGTLYGTRYQRDNQGRIIVDANGLPTYTSTREYIGKYSPDWTGSISNTFGYRNWTLSFLVDASIGGNIFSNTYKTGIYTGVLEATLPGRDAEHGGLWYYKDGSSNVQITNPTWQLQSDGTYQATINGADTRIYQDGIIVDGVDANGNPNQKVVSAESYYHRLYSIAEVNTFDASYVKLREVSLTYQLPRRVQRRLHLQDLQLTLTGRNLWTIYREADDIDPEASITSGNAQGVEAYALPSTRSWGVNLSFKF